LTPKRTLILTLAFLKLVPGNDTTYKCLYFWIAEAGFHISEGTALYFLWYKNFPLTGFHFFNDIREWQGMDKAGHIYSSYIFAEIHNMALQNLCPTQKHELLKSAILATSTMLVMEILDGFSQEWGFSLWDLGANITGSLLWLFGKHYTTLDIFPSFSYHDDPIWRARPSILGSTLPQRLVKNYNGQTYWLIIGVRDFPLGISIGYNAYGMTGSEYNPPQYGTFTRGKQFLISIGFTGRGIKYNSKALDILIKIARHIKVPFPALAIDMPSQGPSKLKFYPLYF